MRAIVANPGKSLQEADAFEVVEQDEPVAGGHDLLVRIEAVSVNPIDTKLRQSLAGQAKVLGWDAAGVVETVGELVTLFQPGDQVYYAGDVKRPGSNAEYQLVDERITGPCPTGVSVSEAAAMPLTSITAWESLFDRMKIDPQRDAGKRLLIIGAAGGVGSIAIQLAKAVAGLEVIATASRPETSDWCRSLGADAVINHREPLAQQFQQQSIDAPDYILCLNDTDVYFPVMAELIAPQGTICALVSSAAPQDLNLLKAKSVGFVWEFMFTRSSFNTHDLQRQHEILVQIAELLQNGKIRSTLNQDLGPMSPQQLVRAHQMLESGATIGKIALGGFE
ncbi:MAG: zinc-binding alcohol dehydrogenase family protein [Gammaproteobacteria bacterium]|nr:zinc-binding alcohol dehydrogenase family protein [Gammaproteobacteria bacterium]